MLIQPEDIAKCRPIAENIGAGVRIQPYIEEAEQMYIMPELGGKLFNALYLFRSNQTSLAGSALGVGYAECVRLCTPIFPGGWYNNDTEYFAGLRKAIAYLAYSRMVRNHSVNVTAFGVVYKSGELSVQADAATIARISNEAEKIGLQHLRDCKKYLQFVGLMPSCNKDKVTRPRFRVL